MQNLQTHIIFPHQLFKTSKVLDKINHIILVEEYLFFSQYKFHKQKIAFHRASMKAYQAYLESLDKTVTYIEATNDASDIRVLLPKLLKDGFSTVHIIDPTDNWLEKHIKTSALTIEIKWYDNPLFINTKENLSTFFKSSKKKFFQTSFYKSERKQKDILMHGDQPEGGKWTYDADNRKKYPKGKTPPAIYFPEKTTYHQEAESYVEYYFKSHYGKLNDFVLYPIDFTSAEAWFEQFLEQRFYEFGVYEDAIVKEEHFLNHSLLSPLINVGLLEPKAIIGKAIIYAKEHDIPINSTEGFVRQILGWREFIRGVYEVKGTEERTKNFWKFSRKIPASFYDGSTGIAPVDNVIKKVLKTGYAHHIERLMILGNFMVLCEFDPDDVYKWFMELFIDAYDWVMVPNVYGMSLYADGGLMSTKPYISSSNYIMKMSNYGKGEWQNSWDGLFWTFMDKHRDFFLSNPRLSMLIRTFDKMKPETKQNHFIHAEHFLNILDNA
ncbi:cryptochrome/photolyase family protein [Hyunsoonleella pacifica]|uniref:Cryptochrome/photolyase family protein n=1 Tax=Hyunsoonleella pacifica TaxID=1080224 RepID=A0A4Q9FX97_9FLAO|nr:cryptochrome/photolyase family protein [Hyunsoonleella pacifica]TBN19095.1 cryptochrome/photolyase family protein [Hyunsoonleella pacifica]GGD07297.1 cryptochrome/photolyase family protein [Hyunsoonleella pacifica]